MLDLSFTNDPQWQAERERLWQGIEKDLKANFRRKELSDLKHYFFTGEAIGTYASDDAGKIQLLSSSDRGSMGLCFRKGNIRSILPVLKMFF